ncbi:MAG: FAD-dependent monooxygenase [Spirochaetales bacterium]|nr:FAD-dependent monooxygenase [Spirochaetales bacterium]
MNYKDLSLKLSTDYSENELRALISKKINLQDFSFEILKKSLDARKKSNIHWLLNMRVFSDNIKWDKFIPDQHISIPYKIRNKKVVIIGSGPAGMFSALFLQKAGFNVTILERGAEVDSRGKRITNFEQTGIFDSNANYAFGEGGAGTFSDGKLTSRSRRISREREFIMDAYIRAGAPKEIKYLAHPHLGSDNLKIIVKNLRREFLSDGGEIEFESFADDLTVKDGTLKSVKTSRKEHQADFLIVASGHSSYETYRMLMEHGVAFRTKNYALGSRVEHRQELINEAQWGVAFLNGVKAAEYRLTAGIDGLLPVYTFCMCPGGTIVPATAYEDTNIVNGMSQYARDGIFANSALVAGVNLSKLLKREVSAEEALAWTQNLERSFYSNRYTAPGCSIKDFLHKSTSLSVPSASGTSYPLDLRAAPLWEMFPESISNSLREGLKLFTRKLRGFDEGTILGLESKTSAPVQVIRGTGGLCEGFSNLYMVGEGSGYAGGIISSAVDGLKASMDIIKRC